MLKGVPAPLKMTKNVNIECKHDSQTSTYDNDSLVDALLLPRFRHFQMFKLKLRIFNPQTRDWSVAIWRNNRLPNPLEEFLKSHIYYLHLVGNSARAGDWQLAVNKKAKFVPWEIHKKASNVRKMSLCILVLSWPCHTIYHFYICRFSIFSLRRKILDFRYIFHCFSKLLFSLSKPHIFP